jgi:hypothetical protein
MTKFYKTLDEETRAHPDAVALAYGRALWSDWRCGLIIKDQKLTRARFNVGLATDGVSFESLTKRVALVSDTLLLSHERNGRFHEVGQIGATPPTKGTVLADAYDPEAYQTLPDRIDYNNYTYSSYGMRCPSLSALGSWLLAAEPLLKRGLAWYLPTYATSIGGRRDGKNVDSGVPEDRTGLIHYLIKDGRAIEASGYDPVKSPVVRTVLKVDLPFVDGVGLADFSKITVEEFDSYKAFRNFLRRSLLKVDDAVNSVQSERQIYNIGLEIEDELHKVRADMRRHSRNRALANIGAGLGVTGATLSAVYGPALLPAIIAGTTGGLWAFIQANVGNSIRLLQDGKPWYYVWSLEKGSTAL